MAGTSSDCLERRLRVHAGLRKYRSRASEIGMSFLNAQLDADIQTEQLSDRDVNFRGHILKVLRPLVADKYDLCDGADSTTRAGRVIRDHNINRVRVLLEKSSFAYKVSHDT